MPSERRIKLAEFVILPDAFVEYVARFKSIPVPLDTQAEALQSVIETVCLEVLLEGVDRGDEIAVVAGTSASAPPAAAPGLF